MNKIFKTLGLCFILAVLFFPGAAALSINFDKYNFDNSVVTTVRDLMIDPDFFIANVALPNQAPTLFPIGNQHIKEGQKLVFYIEASDPEDDPLTPRASALPAGATITTRFLPFPECTEYTLAKFSWTPTLSQAGTYTVTFKVSDGQAQDEETITITVDNLVPPVNHAPVLVALGSQQTDEGKTLAFKLTATDQDQDTLTFSAANLPSGAQLTNNQDNTADFTWTPTDQQAGTYTVTFTVSDGSLTDSETITLTVNDLPAPPQNNLPVLNLVGDKTVKEGEKLEFTLSATDQDQDTLTFSAENLPTGATFTQNKFSWTPTYDQANDYSVTFKVSDGKDTVSETIKITVVDVSEDEQKVIALENKFKEYEEEFEDLEDELEEARDDDDEDDIEEAEDDLKDLDDDLDELDEDVDDLQKEISDDQLEDRLDDLEEDIKNLREDIQDLFDEDTTTTITPTYSTGGSSTTQTTTYTETTSTSTGTEPEVVVTYFKYPTSSVQETAQTKWESIRPYAWIILGIFVLLALIVFLLKLIF